MNKEIKKLEKELKRLENSGLFGTPNWYKIFKKLTILTENN